MNKQVKKLRRLIEKKISSRYRNILLNLYFLIFVIMISVVIIMNYIKIEPIAFDENNTFKYTYIEVNQVQELVDQYYVADDGVFVYLYHSQEPVDFSEKIIGVPRLVDDDDLENFIPIFQTYYPDLKVNNVDDLIKYTGNYYIDYSVAPLLYDMQIMIIFSCIPFLCWLILLSIKLYYKKQYSYSLKNIISNRNVSNFVDQFKTPNRVYESIHAAVLSDYLVLNHPSPYVIDISNITWIYVENKRTFFLFDKKLFLVIYDQNLKKTIALSVTAFSSVNRKEIKELLVYISNINSKILIGYSEHNARIFSQLKKDNDEL